MGNRRRLPVEVLVSVVGIVTSAGLPAVVPIAAQPLPDAPVEWLADTSLTDYAGGG